MTIRTIITCDECGQSVEFPGCVPLAVLYQRSAMREPISGAAQCQDCQHRDTQPMLDERCCEP